MKNLKHLFLLGFCVIITACGTTKPTTTNTNSGGYDENLVSYLKKYTEIPAPEKVKITQEPITQPVNQPINEVVIAKKTTTELPNRHDNVQMDTLMAALYEFNKTVKSVQGYRISVYSGSDRQEAQKIETDIQRNLLERAEMSYDKPNFRVRVGSFIQRLEAYKTYKKLHKVYPNAIIVLDKININARRRR
jgi:SPOR domain